MNKRYTLSEVNRLLDDNKLSIEDGQIVNNLCIDNTYSDRDGDSIKSRDCGDFSVIVTTSEHGVLVTSDRVLGFLKFFVRLINQINPPFERFYQEDYIYRTEAGYIVTDKNDDNLFSLNAIDTSNDKDFYNLILALLLMKG